MALRPPNSSNLFERVLAFACIGLTGMTLVALARGRAEWSLLPSAVWLHLGAVLIALVLTPVLLLRRRGDARHRLLGWIWAIAMLVTALSTVQVRMIDPGNFSLIHILSLVVLVTVPLLVWHARTHRVADHRRGARNIVTFALLVAGFFTFPFNRLLGHWLLG